METGSGVLRSTDTSTKVAYPYQIPMLSGYFGYVSDAYFYVSIFNE